MIARSSLAYRAAELLLIISTSLSLLSINKGFEFRRVSAQINVQTHHYRKAAAVTTGRGTAFIEATRRTIASANHHHDNFEEALSESDIKSTKMLAVVNTKFPNQVAQSQVQQSLPTERKSNSCQRQQEPSNDEKSEASRTMAEQATKESTLIAIEVVTTTQDTIITTTNLQNQQTQHFMAKLSDKPRNLSKLEKINMNKSTMTGDRREQQQQHQSRKEKQILGMPFLATTQALAPAQTTGRDESSSLQQATWPATTNSKVGAGSSTSSNTSTVSSHKSVLVQASTGTPAASAEEKAGPAGASNVEQNAVDVATVVSTVVAEDSSKLPYQLPTLRSRRARFARTQDSTANAGWLATNGASPAIQALVGQRITIPCSNLSLLQPTSTLLATGEGEQQQQHSVASQAWRTPFLATAAAYQLGVNQRRSGASGSHRAGAPPGKPLANGQGISLIVWHKDDQLDSPIFSADARGASSLREAKQQTGSDWLKGRAHLEESTRVDSKGLGLTPALVIDKASPSDAGLYTCTVEFHKAPTQTHQVRVVLIIPPKNMAIIQNDSNQRLSPGIIGPYDEDLLLSLTCEVEPGEPIGYVSWWQLKATLTMPSNVSFQQQQQRLSSSLQKQQNQQQHHQQHSTFEKAEFLTTMTLDETPGVGANERFLAFLPNDTHNHHFSPSMLTPFASDGSQRLKHWVRVVGGNKHQLNSELSVSSDSLADTRILRANLQLNLARSSLGDEYLCLARNNELIAPLNSSIKINLNLKPTGIRIVNKQNLSFKLGQKLTIECHVYGSKPAPKISWFKDSEELETSAHNSGSTSFYDAHATTALASSLSQSTAASNQALIGGAQQNYISEINRDINNNLTKISYLTLVPQLSHNQQSLTCSAFNPKMPNLSAVSDSIIMNVQFPAQLTLQFGAGIKQDSIKIGSDVFMDCNIQSNPPIDDLIWLFNDQPLQPHANSSIIMSNQSLVLQRVRIEHRGHYQCLAHNSMGKSHSNKLYLKPKFEPVCDYSITKTKYEVAVDQAVRVECNVLAEPGDDVHFTWRFNQTSGDERDLNAHYHLEDIKQYETNFTSSYVMFTPKSRKQYGQLLCSASNSMGKQERPCIIQIVPSELPEPVFGCFFDNLTNNSFSVHCQPPRSSASRQNYLLELYTNQPGLSSAATSLDNESSSSLSPATQRDISSLHAHPPTTHLRQRQQENQDDAPQEDGSDNYGEQGNQEELHQLQHMVRKIRSETPTFHMVELKPGTSYNVIIYVQNSKGRSAPAFYQASTLPISQLDDLNSMELSGATTSTKIQLVNKRLSPSSGTEQSFWDKLTSLPVGDYLGLSGSGSFGGGSSNIGIGANDKYKPILRLALLVLLCTISVVIITFFVGRRVCRPIGAGRNRKQQERHNTKLSNSAVGSSCKQLGTVGSETNKQRGDSLDQRREIKELEQADSGVVQLTTVSNPNSAINRLKGLAGNGSDTSRETNTDSTLISSLRTTGGATEVSVDTADGQPVSIGCTRDGVRSIKATFGTSRPHTLDSASIGQGGNSYISSSGAGMGTIVSYLSQTPSPMLLASHSTTIDEQQLKYSLLQQQKVYSNAIKRSNLSSPLELEHNSNTPQVSIHSGGGGSDCTTSNNDQLQQQADGSDPFHHQLLITKCHEANPNEPLYVFSRQGFEPNEQCLATGSQQQQLRLLNPNNLWPYVEGNGGNDVNQVGSVGTADSCDQSTSTQSNSNGQFKVATATGYQCAPNSSTEQIGFLPSSMSIPVSLGDCVQLRNQDHHHQQQQDLPLTRRLSQNFLAATRDLCLGNSDVGSYLTLAPGDNQQMGFAGHQAQQHSHCYTGLRCSDQPGLNHSEQLIAGLPTITRDFTTPGYERHFAHCANNERFCTQTLDNSHRGQHTKRATQGRLMNRTSDPRRGSFDGFQQQGIVQQQPQRHHVKFETATTTQQPQKNNNSYKASMNAATGANGGGVLLHSNSTQMVTQQQNNTGVSHQQQCSQ